MSKTESNSSGKYRIETNISSGKVKDPLSGEAHEIEATSDTKGEIVVPNPYSAKRIVDETNGFSFVGTGPSEKLVRKSKEEAIEWAGTQVCEAFAESRNQSLTDWDMAPEAGYDPVKDTATNDTRLRILNAYERLQEDGKEETAGFLRALPDQMLQNEFAKFLADREVIAR